MLDVSGYSIREGCLNQKSEEVHPKNAQKLRNYYLIYFKICEKSK